MALMDRPDDFGDDDNDDKQYSVLLPQVEGVTLPAHLEFSVVQFKMLVNDIIPTSGSKGEIVKYAELFTPEELDSRLENIKKLLNLMYETMMKRELMWKAIVKRMFYGQ